MKTKKLKEILLTTGVMTVLLMTNAGVSKAALQSNPNTQYKKQDKPTSWMSAFRNMETIGGGMGLTETLKSDLTASSESNDIDVHMMKSTEYGAIAILSASGYGNPSNANAITTTTGNKTGVILNTGYWEWTAGGLSGSIFSGVNPIYYDAYTANQSSAKRGDALGTASTTNPGTAGWHSANKALWARGDYPYFCRGYDGVFVFSSSKGSNSHYSRGVAISGERTLKTKIL